MDILQPLAPKKILKGIWLRLWGTVNICGDSLGFGRCIPKFPLYGEECWRPFSSSLHASPNTPVISIKAKWRSLCRGECKIIMLKIGHSVQPLEKNDWVILIILFCKQDKNTMHYTCTYRSNVSSKGLLFERKQFFSTFVFDEGPSLEILDLNFWILEVLYTYTNDYVLYFNLYFNIVHAAHNVYDSIYYMF